MGKESATHLPGIDFSMRGGYCDDELGHDQHIMGFPDVGRCLYGDCSSFFLAVRYERFREGSVACAAETPDPFSQLKEADHASIQRCSQRIGNC